MLLCMAVNSQEMELGMVDVAMLIHNLNTDTERQGLGIEKKSVMLCTFSPLSKKRSGYIPLKGKKTKSPLV